MTSAEKRAYQRRAILRDMEKQGLKPPEYSEAYNSGFCIRVDGVGKLSASTLYRWQKSYSADGIKGLAPRYNRSGGARSLNTEDKELIQAYYLDENRPSLAHILRLIKRYHGRSIAYAAARRYINRLPKALKVLKRQGAKAYSDKAAPFIKRGYEDLVPMQIASADHHILDLLCRHPQKGTPFRPWLTMITDYRSRKPLGWHIGITPNRYSILHALEQCVDDYGVPAEIHIDNGKDFRSKLLNGQNAKMKNPDPFGEEQIVEIQGVFGQLGTSVHFTTPYRAQTKPVERFFRVVAETFSKEFPSYTGSNTSDRPADVALYYKRIKGQEKRGDLPELGDVAALFCLWVRRYSAEHKHRGNGMNGRTPDQVFIEESTDSCLVMPRELRALVFSEQFVRTVQRNGINIGSANYYAPDVVRYLGHQIIARRPFRDSDAIIVFSPDGRQLFTAYEGVLDDTGDARKNTRKRASMNRNQKNILGSYLEKPAKYKSLMDELHQARRAAGSNNVVDISPYRKKGKKSETLSKFFKGVRRWS